MESVLHNIIVIKSNVSFPVNPFFLSVYPYVAQVSLAYCATGTQTASDDEA